MKHVALIAALLGCSTSLLHAGVTLSIDVGVLYSTANGAVGSQIQAGGGLLQIIATPSGLATGFSAPSAGRFINGDNILLGSFLMNNDGGLGESINTFSFTYQNIGTPSATTFDPGDPLLLRFYPGLTLSSTGPAAGALYGQLRSNTPDGTVGINGNGVGIAWFGPPDGQNDVQPNGLNYFTTDTSDINNVQGTHLRSDGFASLIVVPEPSAYVLFGLGLSGLALGFFRSHRRLQVAVSKA